MIDYDLRGPPLSLGRSGQAFLLLLINLLEYSLRFRYVVYRGLPARVERASLRTNGPSLEVRQLHVMSHLLCQQLTLVLVILNIIVAGCGRGLSQSFPLHFCLPFLFLDRYEGVQAESLDILVVVTLEFFDERVLLQTLELRAIRVVEVSVVILFDLKFLELAFYLR